MKKNQKLLITSFVLLLIMLSGCLSLAEDITPPPGMSIPTSDTAGRLNPTLQVEEIIYPNESPDPNKGGLIYAEKCAPCHGDNGMGDGPDASILESSVPSLGSSAIARGESPVNWYSIVTKGNMQSFMPPFSSLSNQERWDVVAYLYTLSAPHEVLVKGGTLFIENCAECHGEDGSQGVVDLTDVAFMSERSEEEILEIITGGHELMPAFIALSTDEQWAITAYVRQKAFIPYDNPIETDSAGKEEADSEAASIISDPGMEPSLSSEEVGFNPRIANIDVNIHNNSDEKLPTNLEIVLRGYDDMTEIYTQTLTLMDNDGVQFKDVPVELGRMYFATIEYENAAYGSDVILIEEEIPPLSLEISYYSPSTDQNILKVDRMHLFIDIVDELTLEIFQLYIFTNPSNQILVPKTDGGTVVNFIVPSNASNLYVEDNMSLAYVKTDNGFGITNIYPDVDPYQAVFSYQIPYDGKKMDLTIPIQMDANALIVLAPANGFKVKSDQLEEAGTRQLEDVSYNMLTASGMQTGNILNLSLSGHPKDSINLLTKSENSKINLVIGLGGFGMALIATGLFLWQRNRSEEDDLIEEEIGKEPDMESSDDLIDAIVALDDQYRAGTLPEEAYRQRRSMLKEKLRGVSILG